MSFCPHCGSQLSGQPKFCKFCGSQLNLPPTPEAPAASYEPPVPAYEPPAPAYEPPAPAYEQPAPVYEQPAPVYEQPAPVYEQPAPVYEQPAPVYEQPAPVYEQPAPIYEQPAPVYEQPAPVYEQPAPVYEQPASVYEQPAPVYEQPAYTFPVPPAQNSTPSPRSKSARKSTKKSKAGLIIGIGVALVVIVLAVLFLPKLLGGNPYIGKYNASSITFMGTTVSGSDLSLMGDVWIELKEDDKCTFSFEDERVSGTWSVKNGAITCEIEGETLTGTIKDGTLELDMKYEGMDAQFVFQKDADKTESDRGGTVSAAEQTQSAAETTASTTSVAQMTGYWTLLRSDCADPANAMSEETVQTMKRDLGTEIFLILEEDGSGAGSYFSETLITWGDGKLSMNDLGINCIYTLDGDQLTVIMDFDAGVKYIFVRGEGTPPQVDLAVGRE